MLVNMLVAGSYGEILGLHLAAFSLLNEIISLKSNKKNQKTQKTEKQQLKNPHTPHKAQKSKLLTSL